MKGSTVAARCATYPGSWIYLVRGDSRDRELLSGATSEFRLPYGVQRGRFSLVGLPIHDAACLSDENPTGRLE